MSFLHFDFAARTHGVSPSVIREILKVVAQPDIISFAGGMPAPELFPAEDIAEATRAAYGSPERLLASLQYGPSEGYSPLRRLIAEQLEDEGVHVTEQQVLITTGSQQAIDLIARVFLDPGDEVIVSDPTFLGALQTFKSYQAIPIGIPMDDEGMRTDTLAAILEARKPKLIYAIPSFQNPTGVSMSDQRKAELYEIAHAHGVPIIEDDPYGALYFGGARPTPIKARDRADGVMLLRTFSKVLSPGLRVGYAVLPPEVLQRIMPAKQSADLHTGGLNQVLIHEYLRTGKLEGHLERMRAVYRARRDVMLKALAEHFPAGCHWTQPEGGLFIWVTLPEGLSAEALLARAVAEQKVAFIPGKPFFCDGQGENTCRLNFSNASEADLIEGVRRLGVVIKDALKTPATA